MPLSTSHTRVLHVSRGIGGISYTYVTVHHFCRDLYVAYNLSIDVCSNHRSIKLSSSIKGLESDVCVCVCVCACVVCTCVCVYVYAQVSLGISGVVGFLLF